MQCLPCAVSDDRGPSNDYSCSYGCAPDFIVRRTMTETTDKKVVGRIIKVSRKGWGFISSKEIEFTRIFFHWTSLRQDTLPFLELRTGMHVEFTPIRTPDKGHRAIHVRVIERPKTEESNDETPMSSLQE